MSGPLYEPPAELIPGLALPIHAPEQAPQPEGRGDVTLTPERQPRSLLEKIEDPDYLTAAERLYAQAALRAFDKQKLLEKVEYFSVGDQTDPTTGNCVVPLFEVPAGKRGHVVQVTVDTPNSATITPAAPFANAASFAFIAIVSAGIGLADSAALRPGLVAFAPISAAGPIIPGQWSFNDTNAPVAWGGEQVYYVLSGGSIAAILNLQLQLTCRINVYSHA